MRAALQQRVTAAGERLVLDLADLRRERQAQDGGFELLIERFWLARGERIALLGPSGSGKSTFLDLLALTLAPTDCRHFTLFGQDIAALWNDEDRAALAGLRRSAIGYVLQSGALLPFLTVRLNVSLPLRLLGRTEPGRVDELLDRLGLAGLAGRMPAQLSLGQRQRVAVARALVHRPQLVLADEPTASLDHAAAAGAMSLLLDLVESESCGLVLVTHDPALAEAGGFPILRCRPLAPGARGSRSLIRRDA